MSLPTEAICLFVRMFPISEPYEHATVTAEDLYRLHDILFDRLRTQGRYGSILIKYQFSIPSLVQTVSIGQVGKVIASHKRELGHVYKRQQLHLI